MATDDEHLPTFALPTGKNHVSASEMSMWAQCSWKHSLVQVQHVDLSTPSPVPTFGTACHEGCEAFLRTRCMDASITHRAIDRLWDMCGFRDERDLQRFLDRLETTLPEAIKAFGFGDKSRVEAHRDADLILPEVPIFMDVTFPGWEFVAAELQLYEPIAETGVSLKGFIDGIIKATGKRGETLIWIIDWKTSAWGWKREKREDPLVQAQLVLYKKYWMQKMADPTMKLRDVRCGFVLLKRAAKPGEHIEIVPVSVGDAPIGRVDKRTLDMISSVRHSVRIKNRNSCTYCEFNKTCAGTWIDHKGVLHSVK